MYFPQPCLCCGFPGAFCVQGPMCGEVARVTHVSRLTLSPFGPGSAPCSGLTEIPFLETAKEPTFAFSSGECDVMSLVSGQQGRDQPRWAHSSATGLAVAVTAPGDSSQGRLVSRQEGKLLKINGVTSGRRKEPPLVVSTLLPVWGRASGLCCLESRAQSRALISSLPCWQGQSPPR